MLTEREAHGDNEGRWKSGQKSRQREGLHRVEESPPKIHDHQEPQYMMVLGNQVFADVVS